MMIDMIVKIAINDEEQKTEKKLQQPVQEFGSSQDRLLKLLMDKPDLEVKFNHER